MSEEFNLEVPLKEGKANQIKRQESDATKYKFYSRGKHIGDFGKGVFLDGNFAYESTVTPVYGDEEKSSYNVDARPDVEGVTRFNYDHNAILGELGRVLTSLPGVSNAIPAIQSECESESVSDLMDTIEDEGFGAYVAISRATESDEVEDVYERVLVELNQNTFSAQYQWMPRDENDILDVQRVTEVTESQLEERGEEIIERIQSERRDYIAESHDIAEGYEIEDIEGHGLDIAGQPIGIIEPSQELSEASW